MTLFTATESLSEEQEDCWIVRLSSAGHYLLMRLGKDPDVKELYFEFDHPSAGFYGGVAKIMLSTSLLRILMKDGSERQIGLALASRDVDEWEWLREGISNMTTTFVDYEETK